MMNSLYLDLDSYKDKSYGPHNFHPYPAKFVPQIPNTLIERYSSPGNLVLDPFCGSGTTLVECLLLKRQCVGYDVNPLAALISKVKTTSLSDDQIEKALSIADKALGLIKTGSSPKHPSPAIANIDKWFAHHVQTELRLLRDAIDNVPDLDCRDLLYVAMSAIIGKVSYQESDTRYRAVAKCVPAGLVAELFRSKVNDIVGRLRLLREAYSSAACSVRCADMTTSMPPIQPIDLVVTSPPYLNSYDYYLYHKHRMAWLSIDHYPVQEKEFGSRNKHNDKGLGVEAYAEAINNHLTHLRNYLRTGAKYACVVGDGIVRGVLYKADQLFDRVFLEQGFVPFERFSFEQRKYTRAFTPNLRTTAKQTHVLVYSYES